MKKELNCLSVGEEGIITFVPEGLRLSRRLFDLGVTVGTPVKCVLKAPFGDPSAYRVKGTLIAVRSSDCCGIETEVSKCL